MSLYIDLSEFLGNPIRTGIQRISGELCRYLPPNAAIPVRLRSGGYVGFAPELIGEIGEYFRDPKHSGLWEIRRLGAIENGVAVDVSPDDTILVPEVFDNVDRLAYFRTIPDRELKRYRFIVFDLLPLTHPEYFPPEVPPRYFAYYQLVRRAQWCGFISGYTRDMYYERLKRTSARGGIVLPLGADSLGPRPDAPALNRPLTFSVLGTIEPRKNHELILEAFEPLFRQINGLSLEFIGTMGWVDPEFAHRVQALASNEKSGLRFHKAHGDGSIKSYIEQSRATIYVSSAEGYGLPPVESLWVGTPVIASRTIPSLGGLGPAGIHFVEPLSAVNLRQAVLAFLDDTYANQKAQETMDLNLPTWKSFTDEVLRWCTQGTGDKCEEEHFATSDRTSLHLQGLQTP
jgi:glycosyltransferase involved in cell wall biosynthesis